GGGGGVGWWVGRGLVGGRAVVRREILRDRRKEPLRPNWAALAAAEVASGLLMAARSSAGTLPATAGWPSAVSSLASGVFQALASWFPQRSQDPAHGQKKNEQAAPHHQA